MATKIGSQRAPIGATTVTQRTTGTTLRRVQATADDVRDPAKLARVLGDMQQAASDATQAARSIPFFGGILHKDIAFPGAVNVVLQHRLNRAYEGFLVLRLRSTALSYESPAEQTQSAALDATQITLATHHACTADIWVY